MTNARAAASLGVVGKDVSESMEVAPQSLGAFLLAKRPQIEAALPRHMDPDRMLRIVMTEIRKVPKLARCDVRSLFGAVIQCSQLGLEPGGALGHAYLIPYENNKKGIVEAQLMIGYRGMIDLTLRSGSVSQIYAFPVYKGDDFRLELGLNPVLHHVPNDEDQNDKDLTGAYCVARFKDGTVQFEYMTRKKIDGIRARSRAKGEGPWVTDFAAMCRKTTVRALWKYLPVSIEMHETISRAINLDNAVDLGLSQHNEGLIEGTSTEIEPTDSSNQDQPADSKNQSDGPGISKEEADKRAAADL